LTTSRPSRLLTALLAGGAVVVALQADSAGAVPVPKPRPASAPAKTDAKPNATAAAPRAATPSARVAVAASETISSADAAALKEAVNAARRGKATQAEDLQKAINDPVARKLVEWAILRSDGTNSIDLRRYMAFIKDNPSWPAVGLLPPVAGAVLQEAIDVVVLLNALRALAEPWRDRRALRDTANLARELGTLHRRLLRPSKLYPSSNKMCPFTANGWLCWTGM